MCSYRFPLETHLDLAKLNGLKLDDFPILTNFAGGKRIGPSKFVRPAICSRAAVSKTMKYESPQKQHLND